MLMAVNLDASLIQLHGLTNEEPGEVFFFFTGVQRLTMQRVSCFLFPCEQIVSINVAAVVVFHQTAIR